MLKWIRALFSGRSGQAEKTPDDDALRAGYRTLLEERLAARKDKARSLFDGVDAGRLPPGTDRIHIEIFWDQPGFEARAFTFDRTGRETFSERKMSILEHGFELPFDPDDPIDLLNRGLEELFPLATPEEVDAFCIWEDAPDGGRIMALRQPIDDVDLRPLLLSFFKDVSGGLRERCPARLTAGLHDLPTDITS